MADPGREDPDADLAGARVDELERLHDRGVAGGFEDRGTTVVSSSVSRRRSLRSGVYGTYAGHHVAASTSSASAALARDRDGDRP